MVSTQLDHVLKDLEAYFKCSLKADDQNSCLIKMRLGISVQIEIDKSGFLLVGCRLGSMHMGRYFKELIRAALKSNELTSIKSGVFGFSHRSSQLILFMRIAIDKLSPSELVELFPPFVEKAKIWHDAITKNEIPQMMETIKKSSGFFGLTS